MEAIGTIDEASVALGLARSLCQTVHSRDLLLTIQRDLYQLMAEVSATKENAAKFRRIDASRIQWLETKLTPLGWKQKCPRSLLSLATHFLEH
jgi:cob(I)alamin adenosyltransferase